MPLPVHPPESVNQPSSRCKYQLAVSMQKMRGRRWECEWQAWISFMMSIFLSSNLLLSSTKKASITGKKSSVLSWLLHSILLEPKAWCGHNVRKLSQMHQCQDQCIEGQAITFLFIWSLYIRQPEQNMHQPVSLSHNNITNKLTKDVKQEILDWWCNVDRASTTRQTFLNDS